MAYLLERDAVNGKAGAGFMNINGRNVQMFSMKNFSTEASFQESDFRVVGTRLVQKKTTGVELTGTMTIYYGTPEFVQMVRDYLSSGTLPLFTLQIVNDDEATTVGRQTIAFYNVKLQRAPLAKLDADAEFLTSDISFSFTSFEILEAFHAPETLGV